MAEAPGFLFLNANTPWVYALAQALSAHRSTTALRLYDWPNYRRLKPQWPETDSLTRRRMIVMPPGYAGRLEALFGVPMPLVFAGERGRLRRATGGAEPWVIACYPYLARWTRHVPGERLIYYNLDEYTFYEPHRSHLIRSLERELVERSALTLCLSVEMVRRLRERHPDRAARIQHFPLGMVESFLNEAPDDLPIVNSIGYVGNLTNRVDWDFFHAVARRTPELRYAVVGKLDALAVGDDNGVWRARRAETLALDNVDFLGSVPQAAVPNHYHRYAVNWMPYDVSHGFNVAACPTKIMDAIASGRPFLSTDLPESRHYPNHIALATSAEEAAAKLRELAAKSASHDVAAQVDFARGHSWAHRADTLIAMTNAANRG
ncbi:glycosyltransferase [Phenylobacterium sp.]|uniref:glycosyltransferase family protein n=1 Tax=Phenylobacterium sp. TaxID=1871053 RepID=UPI002737B3DA|nr:glycosyltransferase [Phenylobacterium sp.]MDP3868370.1 glycosyltransferase [Phenylobacterium sp.]